jgi:hypothetical protein
VQAACTTGAKVDGLDEHRPPHAVHAHERPLVVEGALDGLPVGDAHAGGGADEHRRGVGRVHAGEVGGDLDRRPRTGRRRETVPDTEAGAPFVAVDPVHTGAGGGGGTPIGFG